MKVTGTFELDLHTATERTIFKALKEFFDDNFQNYKFEVTGNETLRGEYTKPKELVEPEEIKDTSQAELG